MNRKRSTSIPSAVRTDAGVTVGMASVQIGTVQSGLPTATTGQVIVVDLTRPPGPPAGSRDPRGGYSR